MTYSTVHSVELLRDDDPHWTSCEGGASAPPLKAKIKDELQKICDGAIQLLREYLIPHSTDTETTVVYKKMMADHHRYLAAITHGEAKSRATVDAGLTYRDAATTARAGLPPNES